MAVKFVSRKQWGARPPKAVTKLSPTELAGVAVHWFGTPSGASGYPDSNASTNSPMTPVVSSRNCRDENQKV